MKDFHSITVHVFLNDTQTNEGGTINGMCCRGLCRFLFSFALLWGIFAVSFPHPQVINIINAAQESSPVTVAEALDRVLEILRTTELYSPQLASKEDDPHTSDLVGGLMSVRISYYTYPVLKCSFISLEEGER